MPVFKTYFKIAKKNAVATSIYVVIFIALALLMASNAKNTADTGFKASSVSIGIVDRNQSESSKAIIDYLSDIHSIRMLEDDKEVLQDELFFDNVSYILIIPANFEKDMLDQKDVSLECIKTPNSNSGMYVDIQVEQLIKTLKTYVLAGYDINSAMTATKAVLSINTEVTLQQNNSTTENIPAFYYYYGFLPYIFIAILIQLTSINLLVFNKLDVKKRNICSSLSLKSRNAQLALGSLISSIGVYLLMIAISFILYRNELPSADIIPYYLLNSFAFTLVALSISYFVGTIAPTVEAVSAYTNIFSLGLSFIGGIFVPLSVMSEQVKAIAKFTPTYWYSTVNNIIMDLTKVTGNNFKSAFTGIFIQLCFALAFFSVALVISKKKTEQA